MKTTVQQLIARAGAALESVGIESGRVDAEMILCHVLGLERLDLYLHGDRLLNEERLARVDGIVKRRQTRYPLQYILGEMWFYGRRFEVTEAVMVPTPETELLCEQAVKYLRSRSSLGARILDVGTGSGVIGITVACELPEVTVTAIDVSAEAIEIARRNAQQAGVADRVEFRRSDMFSAIKLEERFGLILSNPPYVSRQDYTTVPPEVKADPMISIVSGEDGLDAIRRLLKDAPDFLAHDGRLMFEVGYDQAESVASITETDPRYRSIDIIRDYNDIDRIVVLSLEADI
ncbi:MAG: peptide chain release factor N(5)-glutamine methyltransferase [Candidatus Zixiibacteriota bacterium]|nr:MAG: peptide chain release factor N(5)-glutamine methyltransferase [candidate division Zixibacteria bacterium]